MNIKHSIGPRKKEEKEVSEDVGFVISNQRGDYLWLKDIPKSRYEGWFCRLSENYHFSTMNEESFSSKSNGLFRVIETIEVEDGGKVLEICNEFNHFERKRENVREAFYLSESSHVFVYELDKEKNINIYFDVREAYSSFPGKDYKIKKEKGFTIIQFNDRIFLAIKSVEVNNLKKTFHRHYPYDENRNSFPFSRDVCKGISLYGKRFVFAVAGSKNEAIKEAEKIFFKKVLKEKDEIDFLCAQKSLSSLIIMEESGMYAGLPWFFHFWPRDEAISLKAILDFKEKEAKDIFFRLLNNGLKKGPGGVINVDAVGWVFKRTEDIIKICNTFEKEKIKRSLKKYIEELLWSFNEDGFIVNRPHETWMDSLVRDGARIEMQAMKLNMYKLALKLDKAKSQQNFYRKMEKEMKAKVKKVFFDGKNLYDGYYPREKIIDKTIRPNIFIAAYIYPELLNKKEWIACFDNALKKLWLPWGGISTIDKKRKEFCKTHTGEDSTSYHQGDSWFYLNNLTAIVLYRFNKKKFYPQIKKIMEASKEEIMWKGAIGSHGEVSSAEKLTSDGCINQAWSNAMYLEARKEIK